MSLEGTATHGGGSCQMSLSYDNGATFRVIKSMIGGCPLTKTYVFTIPTYAPTGNALLAWTWQNLEGNREFYMNCAPVNIVAGMTRRRRRSTFTSLQSLPYIWKANLEGVSSCATTKDTNVVYPNPGPDVVYGAGVSESEATTSGDCDGSTPYGQTYEKRADSNTFSLVYGGSSTTSAVASSSLPSLAAQDQPAGGVPQAMLYGNNLMAAVPTPSMSTVTVTMPCPETVYVTVPPGTVTTTLSPTAYTTGVTGAACSATAAICPCNPGYECVNISPCDWECIAIYGYTPSSSPTAVITSTAVLSPVPASTTAANQPPATGTGSSPPYATQADINAVYNNCVPGTFICSNSTTFYTCDYNDGSDPNAGPDDWVYDYPRFVASGMMCQPQLSPYNSTDQQYAQQGGCPNGYFRNDQFVRATS
jgi:hypothetical protein